MKRLTFFKFFLIIPLCVLAYTRYGMLFPKGSDYFLHLFGGLFVAWLFSGRFALALLLAVFAEGIQPFLCANRGFELHDVIMNLAGVSTFFAFKYRDLFHQFAI